MWPTCGQIGYITSAVWFVPNKGTKSDVAHMWADWLHNPCCLGGSPTREQNQNWPTYGQIGYITPAVWGVLNKGTKSKVAHMGADWLHNPCRLGSPARGQNGNWPTYGQFGYITPAVYGVLNKGTKSKEAQKF